MAKTAPITANVRSCDMAARIGGDEFAVILQSCSRDKGLAIARAICDEIGMHRVVHDSRELQIGASIGVVEFDGRWPAPAVVMQAADMACYAAKQAGRNRVELWHDRTGTLVSGLTGVMLPNRLAQSLDDEDVVLSVQRIVSLAQTSLSSAAKCWCAFPAPTGVSSARR